MRHLLAAAVSLLLACGATPAGDEFAPDANDILGDGGSGIDGSQGDFDAAPTCQANLMSDRQNCGFCGHDCLDLGCWQGACGSSVISATYPRIAGLITDGAALYYNIEDATGAYQAMRHPFSGSETVLVSLRGPRLPRQLGIDLGNIYHTTVSTPPNPSGQIRKTPKSGSGASFVANNQPMSHGAIVHSNGTTYWATRDADIRMVVDGSSEIIPIDSTGSEVDFITQDDTDLYWVTRFDANPGRIGRTAKDGSSNTILVPLPFGTSTYQVSVDDTHVYWKDRQGDVLRIAKTGGSPETISSNEPTSPLPPTGNIKDTINAAAVVVDGVVYWAANGQIRVRRVEGGPIRTLIDLGDDSADCPVNGLIEELYAGSQHIYFVIVWDDACSPNSMQVLRIPKY